MLYELLTKTNYPKDKTQFLCNSFKHGFDIGYRGPQNVKRKAPNLKLFIGTEIDLWNKVMKEVKEKRYAGPFEKIPFENYIQSPIGLVPKDNGTKTRLIFHLSYPKNTEKSLNANTPKELTTVSYPDFDKAVELCIKCITKAGFCAVGKSDMTSAFRHLGIAKKWWKYLVMKAKSPLDKKTYYFVDKCLPFGASISCSHFQAFSDAIAHIVKVLTGEENINYLDDFFFAAICKLICNNQLSEFLDVCQKVNFPVSMEKTFWATDQLVFLGLLIDTTRRIVSIPLQKIDKARAKLDYIINKKNRKITLRVLEELCGLLNFLGKAIVPGRAFTRRIYAQGIGIKKQHHHLKVTKELKLDLQAWSTFLNSQNVFNRPFFHFDKTIYSLEVDWATDATKNPELGMGGVCESEWFIQQWDEDFLVTYDPSINYLELYALTVGILLWAKRYPNQKITIFCDNMSVVHMVNSNSSTCKNCMVLIRLIILESMLYNVVISVTHIEGKLNLFSDYLSRLKYDQFWKLAKTRGKKMLRKPKSIPEVLWPMEKIWLKESSKKEKEN